MTLAFDPWSQNLKISEFELSTFVRQNVIRIKGKERDVNYIDGLQCHRNTVIKEPEIGKHWKAFET